MLVKGTNGMVYRAVGHVSFGNRLLAHDLAIAMAGLKQIFGRPHDVLVMALAGAIAVGFARASIATLADDMRQFVLAGGASFAALSLDLALRSRLKYFRRESALSPVALKMRSGVEYRLTFHLFLGTVFAGLLCLPDIDLFAKIWLSWWITLIPVQIFVTLARLPQPSATMGPLGFLVDLWRSRHAGFGALPVILVAAAIVFLTALFGNTGLAPGVALLLTICLMLWYAPIDYAVVTFERIAGHSPVRSVRARLRIASAAAAALAMAAAVALKAAVVAVIVATAFAVLAYKILEILLSRLMDRRQVQLMLTFTLFLLLAAMLAPLWLAPALLVVLMVWLAWRAGRTAWMLW